MPSGIMSFVENDLGLTLYPVQRLILKLLYGEPLDPSTKFPLFGLDHSVIGEFTEVTYLKRAFDLGRCNIAEPTNVPFRESALCLGRRSGKSILPILALAYETTKMLTDTETPQSKYHFSPSQKIHLRWVSSSKDQAMLCKEEMAGWIRNKSVLRDHLAATSGSRFLFKREDQDTASLVLQFSSGEPRILRGFGFKVVVLDEIEYFDNGEDTYNTASPSTCAFSPKVADHQPIGPCEGKVILISTPARTRGQLYRIFQYGLQRPTRGTLSFQAPTWEVNPSIPSLTEIRDRIGAELFELEFGAQFPRS